MTTYNLPSHERQIEILEKTTDIKTAIDTGTVGKTPYRQVFTTSGTWTAPKGVTRVFVTGGGGGGGGAGGWNDSSGNAGGITSFDNLLSLPGGGGAQAFGLGALGGVAGGPGGQSGQNGVNSSGISSVKGGDGGDSGPYKGGLGGAMGGILEAKTKGRNGGYCSGGGGAGYQSQTVFPGGGGAQFVYNQQITVVPETTYTITIGAGGKGGPGSSGTEQNVGGNGGSGILTIEWWE